MTFREKLTMEHPKAIIPESEGGCKDCPRTYGYEPTHKGCPRYEAGEFMTCDDCWDREIPGTENVGETIRIKYHSDAIDKLTYIEGKSDWIDLRAAEEVELKAGGFKLISLGVSIQLPAGYEAIIAPRSSTFKNFGIIQTNSIGVVDETYCGDNDVWMMPALAMRDTEIHINDRICQFRIQKHQPQITFEEVEMLGNTDRGGIGSTGKQ